MVETKYAISYLAMVGLIFLNIIFNISQEYNILLLQPTIKTLAIQSYYHIKIKRGFNQCICNMWVVLWVVQTFWRTWETPSHLQLMSYTLWYHCDKAPLMSIYCSHSLHGGPQLFQWSDCALIFQWKHCNLWAMSKMLISWCRCISDPCKLHPILIRCTHFQAPGEWYNIICKLLACSNNIIVNDVC